MNPSSLSVFSGRAVASRLWDVFSHLWQSGYGDNFAEGTVARSHDRMHIAEKDWDTLFVLDACRYDMFEANNHLDGTLSKRISCGSTSVEFLRENFARGQYHDIVYVSANPYTARLSEETFHDRIPVYEQWDEDLQTVLPIVMNDAVQKAHETYPNKRIIAHYMQPHYPFIGEIGQRIEHRGYAPDGEYEAMDSFSIWTQLQFGMAAASRKEVRTAYHENLRVVLNAVENLLPDIDGKTVLTADHGNLIGERIWPIPLRIYGHYGGWSRPELLEVPWFKLPFEARREIVCEPPVERTVDTEDAIINKRLRSLGYRE